MKEKVHIACQHCTHHHALSINGDESSISIMEIISNSITLLCMMIMISQLYSQQFYYTCHLYSHIVTVIQLDFIIEINIKQYHIYIINILKLYANMM